jgi:hypothetical protein
MLSLRKIVCGEAKEVVMIVDNNRCLTEEYINSLEEKTRKRLLAIMENMAKRGEIINTEMFRHLSGNIYEFKARSARIFCFFHQNLVVCTHGADKPKQRRLKIEINKAEKMRKTFMNQINKEA